ncbi:unnamed protein product, partial [Ectocarpus sp. 4 AP-2014]
AIDDNGNNGVASVAPPLLLPPQVLPPAKRKAFVSLSKTTPYQQPTKPPAVPLLQSGPLLPLKRCGLARRGLPLGTAAAPAAAGGVAIDTKVRPPPPPPLPAAPRRLHSAKDNTDSAAMLMPRFKLTFGGGGEGSGARKESSGRHPLA